MLALQIGAGNIGRGFIGQLLSEAGFDLYFADVNEELITKLQERGEYTVELADETHQTSRVSGVHAVNSMKEKEELLQLIERADLITTAVGPPILKRIAPDLAEGLKRRAAKGTASNVNIIACENMAEGTSHLQAAIYEHLSSAEQAEIEKFTGFANAAVDRIVPEQSSEDGLHVVVEPFFEWVVEEPSLKPGTEKIPGVTYVESLPPYIERKLFTVNAGHAALAYNGAAGGCETIKESYDNEAVRKAYFGLLNETSELLSRKHGFDKEDLKAYREKINTRFQNPYLSDSVKRVGRGPVRKLGSQERLVHPALGLLDYGVEPVYIAETLRALLTFEHPEDEEAQALQARIKENGREEAFCYYSGLDSSHPLTRLVFDQA